MLCVHNTGGIVISIFVVVVHYWGCFCGCGVSDIQLADRRQIPAAGLAATEPTTAATVSSAPNCRVCVGWVHRRTLNWSCNRS